MPGSQDASVKKQQDYREGVPIGLRWVGGLISAIPHIVRGARDQTPSPQRRPLQRIGGCFGFGVIHTMNSSARPTISVVMAVRNGQSYLAEAIDSVLAQTLIDFEFLIVDDGSSDDTAAILKRYEARDARVRVIRQENTGLTRALNVALAKARGRYIARMDADDVSEPDRFSAQVNYMDERPELVALGCKLSLIDPDGEHLAHRQPPVSHDAIVARLLEGDGAIPHPSAMIRHDALRAAGGYREEFACAQDLDLWLRLSEIGALANLDRPLLRYRLHCDSVTTARRDQQLMFARKAVQDAFSRREQHHPELLVASTHSAGSAAKIFRSWARMALRSGNKTAASKHCVNALRAAPWSISNIGMLFDWAVYPFRQNLVNPFRRSLAVDRSSGGEIQRLERPPRPAA